MAEIKRQFGIQNLQYACVAQEIGDQSDTPHLHIQIILKKKANKKTWFLDDVTGKYVFYTFTIQQKRFRIRLYIFLFVFSQSFPLLLLRACLLQELIVIIR